MPAVRAAERGRPPASGLTCRLPRVHVTRTDPTRPRDKPKKAVVHKNKMKGAGLKKRNTHALYELAKEAKYPRTAEGLSQVGIYRPRTKAVPVDADVSELHSSLKTFWEDEDIDGGVYPEHATIVLGSRVRLWAHETHADIGFAVGHPKQDGKARWGARAGLHAPGPAPSCPSRLVFLCQSLAGSS